MATTKAYDGDAISRSRVDSRGHAGAGRGSSADCDADAVLLKVEQIGGAACHEGYRSCFFRKVESAGLQVVGQRVFDPKEVYGKE